MTVKVYIAAPYEWRAYAQLLKPQLEAIGCTVLAAWLHQQKPDSSAEARLDLDDIDASEIVVVLNPPGFERAGSGGRHVELGYALRCGKKIFLVGAATNVFHHLESVVRVANHDELLDRLAALSGILAGRH